MPFPFARFAASLTLGFALVPAAACSGGQLVSVGADSLESDGGDTDGGGSSKDAGVPCRTSAECGDRAMCGFATGAACTDFGRCFSTEGVAICAHTSIPDSCGCDGEPAFSSGAECTALPSGYTSKAIRHKGVCDTGIQADAGAPCTTDTECGEGICGFLRTAACAAKGTCFMKSGSTCNSIVTGCACDGTEVNLACNNLSSLYSPKPLLHDGACP